VQVRSEKIRSRETSCSRARVPVPANSVEASQPALGRGQYERVRAPLVVVVSLALLSACGGGSSNKTAPLTSTTSTTLSKTDQAQAAMTQACTRFAETFLSTDPTSGVAPMTREQGIANIRAAAATARTATALDGKWASAQLELTALADAMRLSKAEAVKAALRQVALICTPVMSVVGPSTTVRLTPG
jgi:hypothetical protein